MIGIFFPNQTSPYNETLVFRPYPSPLRVGGVERAGLRLLEAGRSWVNMAEARLRARAQVSVEERSAPLLSSQDNQRRGILFLRLFSAVFYGLSSFLIVVVNKSVLSSYRWVEDTRYLLQPSVIINHTAALITELCTPGTLRAARATPSVHCAVTPQGSLQFIKWLINLEQWSSRDTTLQKRLIHSPLTQGRTGGRTGGHLEGRDFNSSEICWSSF